MNKFGTILAFILFISLTQSFNFLQFEENPNDDRVKIDFFFESLCPYCQQYIVGSLKTAANTKVYYIIFRISGRFAISISIHMEMLEDKELEIAGILHANMEPGNAKEILLKHVLLKFMINILKPFHLSSASKLMPVILLPKGPNVLHN